MTPEDYRQAGNLFDQLRELPPNERAAALDATCAGKPDLRAHVLRLLQADSDADSGSFLQRRALDDAARLITAHSPNFVAPGARLGPYEIVAQIGAGGMGQVYKALDTRLHRTVAIKISEAQFSQRFEREALAVAALNHPNICTLYDVGPHYLVLEYVEGPTLAERLGAGAMPLEEALPLARQIAEALEAAHEEGIAHRDLKPANIKLTAEGKVKVLDFGLAKALETSTASGAGSVPNSAALMMTGTQTGAILGTASYMSPEQARGAAADKRADIWAYGVVLFEMLTGQRTFAGGTVADTLAAVLRAEVDWTALPPDTPPAIRRLLRRCLERDRARRLSDIAVAALEIDDAQAPNLEVPTVPAPSPKSWLPYTVAGVALCLALLAEFNWWRAQRFAPSSPLIRLNAEIAAGLPLVRSNLGGVLALSPDGQRLALTLRGADGRVRLYTRLLRQSEVSPLAGTENASSPFFSPDSQWIGFAAAGKLKKISVDGGPAVTLCEAPAVRGASWGDDGQIVVSLAGNTPLSRVPAEGGAPAPLTKLGPGERSHRWPYVLPGSQAVLFTQSGSIGNYEDADIELFSLRTGARTTLLRRGFGARYLATSRGLGHVVYVRQSTLFAVPFDPGRLAVAGSPVPVLADISSTATSGADLDASLNGTLVYLPGVAQPQGYPILWLDSSGETQPLAPSPAVYATPRVSPDGKRVAFSVASGQSSDLWVKDLGRDTPVRLSFLSGLNRSPVWTPDSKHIVFQSDSPAGAGLYWIRSDGAGEPHRLTDGRRGEAPDSFSPDGKRLAFHQSGNGGSSDIYTAVLEGDPARPRLGKPDLFLGTPFAELGPAFSPDGRWLAYASDESGTSEVYVRAFPGPGGRWQISTGGGYFPVWSRAGAELFFRNSEGLILAVPYSIRGDSFVAGKPRQWSDESVLTLSLISTYDMAPDGKRMAALLAINNDGQKLRTHLIFLLNFFDELRRRAPAGNEHARRGAGTRAYRVGTHLDPLVSEQGRAPG